MIDFLSENYILIVLIIGFILLLKNSLHVEKSKTTRLKELILAVAIVTIFSALETYFGTWESYNIYRVFCSFICYSIRPLVVINFISLLTDNKNIKYFKLLTIINCLIFSTCFFTDIAFSFSESNSFQRGPLGYSTHILCLIYLALLVYIIIRKHSSQNRMKTVMVSFIALACTIAAIFDFTGYEINLFDHVILICILIYYLYLYMEYNKIDALTGTFNRNSFYSDLEKYKSKLTSIISIDMNDLKQINDTYGHTGGDEALLTVSEILLSIDKRYVRVYRTGGDEFVILCFYNDDKKVEEYIKKTKEKLSKTKYTCSFGYSLNTFSDIFDTYKEADSKMYIEKEKYHEKRKKETNRF